MNSKQKQVRLERRKAGIRKRVVGTPQRPRLTVFRSLRHIYAQVVDDMAGRTLVAANSVQLDQAGANKTSAAVVGKTLAQRAVEVGIKEVSFDRNGMKFHGRVKALADAAREGGLKF